MMFVKGWSKYNATVRRVGLTHLERKKKERKKYITEELLKEKEKLDEAQADLIKTRKISWMSSTADKHKEVISQWRKYTDLKKKHRKYMKNKR